VGFLLYTQGVAHWFLFLSLVVVALVAYLDHQARLLFWYWEYPWFDVLMHFLGGVAVGAFMVWVRDRFVPHLGVSIAVLLGLLAVGVSWEIFEWFAKAPTESDYVIDTAIDLGMDVIGAVLVIGMYFVWKRK
jgi:hypothetical protein